MTEARQAGEKRMTRAHEAIMGELLQDVDGLLKRVEQLENTLPDRIGQATKDATGKSFLTARLNFESMVAEQERRLIDAGRTAAATIGNQLNRAAENIITANDAFSRRTFRMLIVIAGVTLVAAIIGGFIGVKLAGT